jgi:hypothetical protein
LPESSGSNPVAPIAGSVVGIGLLGLLLLGHRRRALNQAKSYGGLGQKLGQSLLPGISSSSSSSSSSSRSSSGGGGGAGGGAGGGDSGSSGAAADSSCAAALEIDTTNSASLPNAGSRIRGSALDCTICVASRRGELETASNYKTASAPAAAAAADDDDDENGILAASGNADDGMHRAAPAISAFTPAQLSQLTGKSPRILGVGAFGTVVAGALADGRPVAIKQMQLLSAAEQKKQDRRKGGESRANPYAGEAGFKLELEVLSEYAHPCLVALIGYCINKQGWRKKGTVCSLVLEYMPGGSLLDRLDPEGGDPPLAAQERFDVAADVARGLHYLHAEASTPLIHQDVKSDNILLAQIGWRLVAKVADFGTARMAPQLAMTTSTVAPGGGGGKTHHSTNLIIGTKPYMPAEYVLAGHISEKTDTFAYGVVLLELLTGKPPYDESTGELLHTEAYELLCDPPRRLAPLLDPRVRPASSWAMPAAAGKGGAPAIAGRALELCLVAKRCLEAHVKVRGTMREAMPAVVALAGDA